MAGDGSKLCFNSYNSALCHLKAGDVWTVWTGARTDRNVRFFNKDTSRMRETETRSWVCSNGNACCSKPTSAGAGWLHFVVVICDRHFFAS